VLRRQMRRNFRSPLVIFTPKSLLRAPRAVSPPEAFAGGGFQRVIQDDASRAAPDAVQRLILCSGKVYYDLQAEREKRFGEGSGPVAIVRLEQLYPWPEAELVSAIESFPGVQRVVWAQEEPANMGPWTFVRERIQGVLLPHQQLAYAGRREAASPAAGSARIHRKQQEALVAIAFDGLP